MRPAALLALCLPLAFALGCAAPQGAYRAPQPEAGPNGEEPLHVGFLLVDGVYNTELTAPWDVFHHSMFRAQPGMRVFSVAPYARPVVSFEGLRIVPDYTLETAPPVDVLVVPSAHHSMDTDLEDERTLDWVRRAGERAELVLSLCDGAFVLAAAGLLDGLEATTFPGDLDAFEERFGPRLKTVHRDVSFVHDGKAVTSAGGAVSFDAALYVHDLYFGPEATRASAGGLVLPWELDAIEHVIADGAVRPDGPLHLVVLHTNDVHGQLLPRTHGRGDERYEQGGLPRLAARVEEIRATLGPGQELLLVDGGDWFQGTPEGGIEQGEAFVQLLAETGFDAMAVGNHEFDHGVPRLVELLDAVQPPAVMANVYDRGERVPWAAPYRIVERGGLRIALVGLVAEETPMITHPDARGLEFRDPADELAGLWDELEAEADLVIALTHIGVTHDRQLAEAIAELPLIVGGHSHTRLPEGVREGDTLIVQTGSKAQQLGRVDLWIDRSNGDVLGSRARLLDLRAPAEGLAPTFDAACEALAERAAAEMDVVVGRLAAGMDRARGIRSSSAGNLITDLFRERAQADVGIHNKGGVRTSLEAGEVTRRDLFEILPFDNTLVVLDVKGSALRRVLARSIEGGGHSGIDVSGLTIRVEEIGGAKTRLLGVEIGGEPLVPDRTYRVATNSFLAAGGDGYLTDDDVDAALDTGFLLRELLEDALKAGSPLTPPTEARFVEAD
ncbi:MAG: 5'-nucleotidase C-terminal domain-containing protein [Planctomycetota bacterium]